MSDYRSIITVYDKDKSDEALLLAEKLGLMLTCNEDELSGFKLSLRISKEGLILTDGQMSLKADFSGMKRRIKSGAVKSEILLKAARIKGKDSPTAIDATAGLGEDSILLAAGGFKVTMYERDPIIAALLGDALLRAKNDPEICEIASRMTLVTGDSISAMNALDFAPDVILLDPMFPEREKSALVKKKFQLLHHLESPCTDEEELLSAAISANPHKIVIKRPVKGPYLAGYKPSYSLGGKAIRYDCIVKA